MTPGNEGLLPPALSNSAGISNWGKPAHRGDPTPEPTLKFSWKSWGHCGRARGGAENVHVMPFLLHSITLDWSIGLISEFRFHLTNSPISRLGQTPKPLYFFLKKSRFSDLRKKGKIWPIWGGRNLKFVVSLWVICPSGGHGKPVLPLQIFNFRAFGLFVWGT